MSTQSGLKEVSKSKSASRRKPEKPHLWKVILLNDDITTIDFVIRLLKTVFEKSDFEAEVLTFQIHNGTSGVVGVYPKSIAEAKKLQGEELARSHGFPLKISIEREE